ncbi:hypothetical protein KUCAC02_030811 [Chaenocephalus aceratus]|uniref:Uncharacterized protein n=1 Tax=Chaenocephalus aceratus TaxID=36190 RepID=A0ACB9XL87_CHAAC|nr:hypothetical protein KUCAC02_030811 [Chaenocephalus aceratus]
MQCLGIMNVRTKCVIQAPLPLPVDKEALHRAVLEQKLATLQRLLANTQEASESSWQALIDEDRLLSRLEVMGSQLQAYSKSQPEEGIRKELLALQEDKHNYETTAKESLRRVLQEKIEVVRKLSEVERSLSNTEDECTHLKEMSERGQEELRELANKYNAAVNEIKELTEKIKEAEGRQEELTQRGATEKRELELRIEEMEEKEQVLQARIEALQADNDFTNERLAALQVRLEQLQEKSIKENNSLDVDIVSHGPVEEAVEEKQSLQTPETSQTAEGGCEFFHPQLANLMNNQSGEGDILASPDRLKENQTDGKESDMSDTLSPSKDRSSDDTSDGNMDDQELIEPQNRGALLKAELNRAGLEPGDTEQVIHHLHRELLDAQELANTGKQRCLELQALLEEETRSNSRQTEESTKQIQYLQTQLGKLQADMEGLREQRESTICSTREELYCAQEEIIALRHAMETATTEREREISALQADLGSVRSELERWRDTAESGVCYVEAAVCVFAAGLVTPERGTESSYRQTLTDRVSRQQADSCLISMESKHHRMFSPCREYEDTQSQLLDLRQRYERTEKEKLNIHQELEQCRSSLKLLQDKTSSSGWSPWMPVIAVMVAVTAAILYPNFSKSSCT